MRLPCVPRTATSEFFCYAPEVACAVWLCLSSTVALASTSLPLNADRPDFTESVTTLAPGQKQIEGGYLYVHDRADGVTNRDQEAPQLLMRVGLSKNTEFRLGWPGYSLVSEGSSSFRGVNDVELSLKARFFSDDNSPLGIGSAVALSIPSGDEYLSSNYYDPQVKLLWSYDLSSRLNLSGNFNLAWLSDGNKRFLQRIASLSFNAVVTDRFRIYTEYFGFYPDASNRGASHYLSTGFAYLVKNDLQFDARIGGGINSWADDFFIGPGFVFRF